MWQQNGSDFAKASENRTTQKSKEGGKRFVDSQGGMPLTPVTRVRTSLGSPPSESPGSAGLLLSPSAAGQDDLIFACGGVAVANMDHANVYGRSSLELADINDCAIDGVLRRHGGQLTGCGVRP
jgi:hypothetical protein